MHSELQERREYTRYETNLHALISFENGGDLRQQPVRILNISQGGAYFLCQANVPTGSRIDFDLIDARREFARNLGFAESAPDNYTYRITGMVLRRDELTSSAGMAVQFNSPLRILAQPGRGIIP